LENKVIEIEKKVACLPVALRENIMSLIFKTNTCFKNYENTGYF